VERKATNSSKADRNREANPLTFAGFERPTYTAIPNELYDVLMPSLSPAEFKVILYVARRTFGFKRGSDRISASQFERGIISGDGRVLDRGTGLSRRAIYLALERLISKRILLRNRHSSQERGDESNEYALNINGIDPWSNGQTTSTQSARFTGVKMPAYTLTPDEIFDVLLYSLFPAELKVLLYVTRRTFGFNKLNDRISLSQFTRGILRRDGSALDSGTGLTRRTVQLALDSMVQKHILLRRRRRNENGDEPNEYALNIIGVDPFAGEGSVASSAYKKQLPPQASTPRLSVAEPTRGSVFNAEGGASNAEGSVRGSAPSASRTPRERFQCSPGVNQKTHGGVHSANEPECIENAHKIQKNKKEFDKTLTTLEKSSSQTLKRIHTEALVTEILEVTSDPSSRNFYLKLARNLPEDLIRTAIRDTYDERATGRIKKTPGAFFTDWLKRLVETRGLVMP
jgi:hypothetical protein